MSVLSVSDHPRAFAVWFRDLHRWSVNSFFKIGWQWPDEYIKPLSAALTRRQEEVKRAVHEFADLQLMTLHFDGEMEPRDLRGKSDFKGKLFFAHPGDVIYSKIDVRNGAIGVVPSGTSPAAVSSEYPVYQVNAERADPQYIKLLFRTSYFRQTINSMISGASGRKRVQPEQLEAVMVPLPPFAVQQAIVAQWHEAQEKIAAARARVKNHHAQIHLCFLRDVGLRAGIRGPLLKAFAVPWKDLIFWSGRATHLLGQEADLAHGTYPVVTGRDCLTEIKHGCSASPSPVPTKLEVLKISAVTRGALNPAEKKYAFDVPRFRREFDLKQGDLLLCRTNGTLGFVGMAALVTQDLDDLIFPDKVIRVRCRENVLPEYIWTLLHLPPLRAQIEAAARTAVGNYAVGTEDLWRLQIPLPPLDVQREIVARVAQAREQIAREQQDADDLARTIKADIEAQILGARQSKPHRHASDAT